MRCLLPPRHSRARRTAQGHPWSRNAPRAQEDAHGMGAAGGVRTLLSGEDQVLGFSYPPEAR